MKIVVLTLALTLLSLISHTNAGNPLIMVFAKTCQKNESASEEDVENLSDGIVPETPAGKCLLACMGKQFTILVDNKLSKDGFVDKVTMKFANDQPSIDKAREVADVCEDTFDEDRCESAYEIWKCVSKEAEERDLKLF